MQRDSGKFVSECCSFCIKLCCTPRRTEFRLCTIATICMYLGLILTPFFVEPYVRGDHPTGFVAVYIMIVITHFCGGGDHQTPFVALHEKL